MKSLILLLIALSSSLFVKANSDTTHMSFKDVSFNTTIEDFVGKMKQKGYNLDGEIKADYAVMKGKFLNESCILIILATPTTKTVCKVALILGNPLKSWYDLKKKYNDKKELFSKKYGQPKDHFEFFSDPYYEGDGYEISAVKNEKCHYISIFQIQQGTISVKIIKDCQIRIAYEDEENMEIYKKEEECKNLEEI